MKIAFNAIRVSNKAGSGFDTFIINFINAFAKYVYSELQTQNSKSLSKLRFDAATVDLELHFDVYTLYPHHFHEVKKEDIKHIKIPFLSSKPQITQGNNEKKIQSKKYFSLTPIYYILHTIYCLFGDYFRMFWTQFVFPFYAKKYDLVVAMTHLDAVVLLSRKKQIIFVYDLIPFKFKNEKHKHKFYLYFILPWILKNSKRIISISHNTKNDVVEFFKVNKNKVDVIYPGIKYKLNKLKQPENFKDDYILFVGSSLKHKNLLRVIEAFCEVKRNIFNIKLFVVGYIKKSKFSYIMEKIEDIVLKNDIKFFGHIEDDELKLLYSNARCFVFPSLYEGFGLPPLEAMACGCPVVVSSCGSLPEVCGDAAVYVDPYNPKSIAGGILKVLSDEKLRQELIEKGFEQVKKFTWEKSVQKFVELLQNV